ncbi:MAG: DUF1015 domain-containing protein [Candidatus Rokubacteria bacterium]|nr:DUF1015 domain-containing protein [Candidatus Rokubacteria bacterium]
MRLHPFRALRPAAGLAPRVASPPYDVVSREEAARLAAGNPLSFLHVCRSDIDVPADVHPHDARVYAKARESLDRLVADEVLIRETSAALYLYRQVMGGRAQVGVVGCVHVDDYEQGVIRQHERTRPDKEDDRTRHVLTLDAHAEPVLLAYRGRPEMARLAEAGMQAPPLHDFTAPDGVRHTVWRLADPAAWVANFGAVTRAYVADGHHRSASAWRAARERRAANPHHRGDEEYSWFLAALFPAAELRILPYNRVVRDLKGQTVPEVLEQLGRLGRLSPTGDPAPPRPGSFCLYLSGRWHLLELPEAATDRVDPIGSLDVSLLHDRILGPVLGIGDPRTDQRLDFVGGIRGARALEARVDSGEMALGVSMYPTTMEQLLAVADAGAIMPPKSTWFEPKLLSGLFVHTLG